MEAKQRCEIWRVVIVLVASLAGMASLLIAISMPEWFIIIQEGPLEGHVGFFRRCVYGPTENDSLCENEIVQGML